MNHIKLLVFCLLLIPQIAFAWGEGWGTTGSSSGTSFTTTATSSGDAGTASASAFSYPSTYSQTSSTVEASSWTVPAYLIYHQSPTKDIMLTLPVTAAEVDSILGADGWYIEVSMGKAVAAQNTVDTTQKVSMPGATLTGTQTPKDLGLDGYPETASVNRQGNAIIIDTTEYVNMIKQGTGVTPYIEKKSDPVVAETPAATTAVDVATSAYADPNYYIAPVYPAEDQGFTKALSSRPSQVTFSPSDHVYNTENTVTAYATLVYARSSKPSETVTIHLPPDIKELNDIFTEHWGVTNVVISLQDAIDAQNTANQGKADELGLQYTPITAPEAATAAFTGRLDDKYALPGRTSDSILPSEIGLSGYPEYPDKKVASRSYVVDNQIIVTTDWVWNIYDIYAPSIGGSKVYGNRVGYDETSTLTYMYMYHTDPGDSVGYRQGAHTSILLDEE